MNNFGNFTKKQLALNSGQVTATKMKNGASCGRHFYLENLLEAAVRAINIWPQAQAPRTIVNWRRDQQSREAAKAILPPLAGNRKPGHAPVFLCHEKLTES